MQTKTKQPSVVGQREIDRQVRRVFHAFKRQRFRSMRQFALEEIVIPSGQFEGRRFDLDRQPLAGLWFDLVDSGRWPEMVITGPSQSGKTLIGFVIPVLYHLFERSETVIAAVPDAEMARDKLAKDLEPVIARTRYRDLLPTKGPGSKGGRVEAIRLKHGPSLRFMTAGGSDKSRAGFTARVICMTETDGFDVRTSTSTEADKIEQIEARVRAFPLRQRRIYKECTVTVAEGHTWRRYQAGTRSNIHLPCPHCGAFVLLGREHFAGWQEAESDVQAVRQSAFSCAACGAAWSEADRRQANAGGVVVHRGQSIEAGQVIGEVCPTHTLGFRWSAVNNLLVPAGDVGLDEFKAVRAVDEDNEQRKLAQFVWCVPYVPKDLDEVPLTVEHVQRRSLGYGRGVCPDATRWVTIGIDVNKPVLHWTAMAWIVSDERRFGHIIDYGKQGVRHAALGFYDGLVEAIQKLQGKFGQGWSQTPEKIYDRVVIDARWQTGDLVAALKQLRNSRWRPFMGLGQGHWKKRPYVHPDQRSKQHVWIGNAAYERVLASHKARFLFADANQWKTWLHSRLLMDLGADGQPSHGCITIFATTDEADRRQFARHLTAEKEVVHFEAGKGYVKTWEAIRSANHWLDATYMACVAGNRCGFRLDVPPRRSAPQDAATRPRALRPAFSPFAARR